MEDFNPGDVLFSLGKDSNKIITTWNRLQPLLADNHETEGAYFKLLKKAKYKDL
jgi:hypothetical protein